MIFKYKSPKFEELQNLLFIFFEKQSNNQNLSHTQRNLVTIFYKILMDTNLDTLHALDDFKLSFNDWDNVDITISIASEQNSFLFDLFADKNLSNFDFDAVLNAVFIVFYADFYEASLLCEDLILRHKLKIIVRNLNENISYLSKNNFKVLTELWFIIPQRVFTIHLDQHLKPEVIKTVKDLQNHEYFINKTLRESNKIKSDISLIQQSLEKQKTNYNFIGLSDGFKTLKDHKLKELRTQNRIYYSLMFVVLASIVGKSYWSISYLEDKNFDSIVLAVTTISTILLILIILYFFRISLVNIKSIKSQILQIDLRLTLCQFIHNYETDTAKLRNKDMKESFDKFESVIFAPLVATEEQMPATFDGLEQLTGLLSSFNKGSK